MIVDSSPREMLESESIKRFREGLKLARSCSKEMEARQPARGWDTVTTSFDGLIHLTDRLLNVRAQSKSDLAFGLREVEKLSKITVA